MKDALLLVDLLNDFEHEDGERLLESFRARHEGMVRALGRARGSDVPVVYANDNYGVWDGDRAGSCGRRSRAGAATCSRRSFPVRTTASS